MQQEFTAQFMEDNRGCYSMGVLYSCSFMHTDQKISLRSILESEIPLLDKYWFVCKALASAEGNRQIGIDIAQLALPIYEKKYPSDASARNAIEAAKLFLRGQISAEQVRVKAELALDAHRRAQEDIRSPFTQEAHAVGAAYLAATNSYQRYGITRYAIAVIDSANKAGVKEELQQYVLKFCI